MSRRMLAAVAFAVLDAVPVAAQLDPLLFLKRTPPNVLLVVDTGSRMQRDAPADPANPLSTSSYYDPSVYSKTDAAWEATLGVPRAASRYRRKYVNLVPLGAGGGDLGADRIDVAPDTDGGYASFEAPTRLAIARAALHQAVSENQGVARFGLIKMRQASIAIALANAGPVAVGLASQQTPTDDGAGTGRWTISRPVVSSSNGAQPAQPPLVRADAAGANASVLALLARDIRSDGLIPAGSDDFDAPVEYLLDDARAEAARLIAADLTCTNTIVVLVVGGAEGTSAGSSALSTTASSFADVAGRRVPVHVVAIAPASADVRELRAIASNSGGRYTEITRAQIDAALVSDAFPSGVPGTMIVPEAVRAIEIAVQHAFARFVDVNASSASEFQTTSPTVGTVNLENAAGIDGAALPLTSVYDKARNSIPQRSNLLVTSGFALPGFDGVLRGFRLYAPRPDPAQFSGFTFATDGTRLWMASVPTDPNQRNLYTSRADGTILAFTVANAGALAPLMNLGAPDAANVIARIRAMPLGAIVDSTPAIMSPPSLDPAPDADYPAFAAANRHRRSIVWVGTNRGVIEGIDARDGVEVWGFIPLNLLPKLKTIVDGEPVGTFEYFVDGSPKVADVKVDGVWKTYMFVGEGPGGTFYQAFDVTLDGMAASVGPTTDAIGALLAYFADPTRISLRWAFPSYASFDPAIGKYGDLAPSASVVEKTVGQTWSVPAVGQVGSRLAPYTVLLGSGFLPYSTERRSNRAGVVAGTTFYVLDAATGGVFDSRSVVSDGSGETIDDCSIAAGGCAHLKNALQSDPVATGVSESRFITKVYIPDLDGNVWRFEIGLSDAGSPKIGALTRLYSAGDDQPIFGSLGAVAASGASEYLFFGTGSDLLPSVGADVVYHMLGILDAGGNASKVMDRALTRTVNGNSIAVDERVTGFPAVAGDVVFYTTTTFKPGAPCASPDANLYAFTFVGGPAYDNTGDDTVGSQDTPLVRTIAGQRATAPFVVDRHLVFGTGSGRLELFGDPNSFNNGAGQAGIRILSWRDVR